MAELMAENCTKDNFPLQFHDVELVVREAPENLEFIQRFVPKIDWEALVDTARQVSCSTKLLTEARRYFVASSDARELDRGATASPAPCAHGGGLSAISADDRSMSKRAR